MCRFWTCRSSSIILSSYWEMLVQQSTSSRDTIASELESRLEAWILEVVHVGYSDSIFVRRS